MDKDDIIRICIYTVATAVYLTVFNVVLAADAFMRTTNFALFGSLTVAFTWVMLIVIDLTFTVGSFSDAWVTVFSVILGLCIVGFGIYMLTELKRLDWKALSADELSSGVFLSNIWKTGVLLMPLLGGVLADIVILWRVRYKELSWWLIMMYAAAYFVCVILCAIFVSLVIIVMIIVYVVCIIVGIIVGVMTVKEVFF